ncbi:MAG: 8-hydroxy-5-deazaflavin:NADPH oxidoreductase [Methanocella sp. PtaU1.Bin125]|nr:MAG: 8-hydroxy-5-deazaflavin:NADPH oxidoreductase [Methanocella sp. PtaU1.Bin125]
MKIAIIGGTGDIGEGLALRLAQQNDVIIGSREAAKAQEAADGYNKLLKERGMRDGIRGMSNEEAAKNAEVVILAVRYQFAVPTVQALINAGALKDQIVITPIVPMSKQKLCSFTPAAQYGSATKECSAALPEGVRLVSTFQSLPAPRLADLDDKLGFDVIVCADDEEAKKTAMKLAEQLGDIRALDGGTLAEAGLIESLTPLLINLAIKNKTKPLSIKFV